MHIPGPTDVLRAVGDGYRALDRAIALLPRVVLLVSDAESLLSTVRRVAVGVEAMTQQAEALLGRAAVIADGGDALLGRATGIATAVDAVRARANTAIDEIKSTEASAQVLVRGAEGLLQRTDALVGSAGTLTARVEPLFDELQPTLRQLQPLLARIAATTGPQDIDAVAKLVRDLPHIVDQLDSDILPVLDTLATVAPDLRDLLDICKELSELIGSVPGLSRVKKKIEDSDWQDDYLAIEEPQAAPERRPSVSATSGVSTDGTAVLAAELAGQAGGVDLPNARA